MPAAIVRLAPFFAASVAVHAGVFLAVGPDPLAIAPAPAGIAHQVSVRLEAAAPAERGIAHEQPVSAARRETTIQRPKRSHASREPASARRGHGQTALAAPMAETRHDRPVDPPPARAPTPRETVRPTPPQARPAERLAAVKAPAGGSAPTSSPMREARVREALELRLARHFRYPRLAQRRGWEGTVVLSVSVLPDGRLENVQVTRSSGRALLDRAASRSLGRIGRLPELAGRIGDDGLVLQIPVTYRLEAA